MGVGVGVTGVRVAVGDGVMGVRVGVGLGVMGVAVGDGDGVGVCVAVGMGDGVGVGALMVTDWLAVEIFRVLPDRRSCAVTRTFPARQP